MFHKPHMSAIRLSKELIKIHKITLLIIKFNHNLYNKSNTFKDKYMSSQYNKSKPNKFILYLQSPSYKINESIEMNIKRYNLLYIYNTYLYFTYYKVYKVIQYIKKYIYLI
jgi:hypothetical protein